MTAGTIQIKGAVLKARLALIEQVAPGKGLPAVLARLQPDEAAALRTLLATKWYPFRLGERLDAAIVDDLGGVHKQFLVEGDPHAFLSRAPMIYAFYYDRGRREYEKAGAREAVLTTRDAEVFSVPDCATVVGWHQRALEMLGAKNPRVVEEECRARGGEVCRYRLRWD
jgi:uncharacterized protein (TIGR02265 family)